MKPVLSYCTAKMFSMSLLPMATMGAPKAVAENDNDRLVPFPAVLGPAGQNLIRRPLTALLGSRATFPTLETSDACQSSPERAW